MMTKFSKKENFVIFVYGSRLSMGEDKLSPPSRLATNVVITLHLHALRAAGHLATVGPAAQQTGSHAGPAALQFPSLLPEPASYLRLQSRFQHPIDLLVISIKILPFLFTQHFWQNSVSVEGAQRNRLKGQTSVLFHTYQLIFQSYTVGTFLIHTRLISSYQSRQDRPIASCRAYPVRSLVDT